MSALQRVLVLAGYNKQRRVSVDISISSRCRGIQKQKILNINTVKTTKTFIPFALAGLLMLFMSSCDMCKNENPRARVLNNGTKNVSVQIKTSDGNTENINNVSPQTTSSFRSYAPGLVTFTIVVDKTDVVKTVQMNECFEYDIAIDAYNNISSVPTDRND